jgi:serine/threonine protein kinase
MGPFALLKCIGKAVVKQGLNVLTGGLLGDVLEKVAEQTMDDWGKQKQEQERREELLAMAQATLREVTQQVAALVAELAGDQPEPARRALAAYLLQVPAAVRQTFRRATDPSGKTIPAGFSLRKAEDLLRILPAQMPRFQPGDRPPGIGDWQLEELLGTGGFGEVWKARNVHRPQAEPVALKFCLDEKSAAALRNEVDLLDRVVQQGKSNPGVVKLLHTYLTADPPCLEYEYVEGGDLAGLIQEWHQVRSGPTPVQAARTMLRIARIVQQAHRAEPPIVHRDLKPANILVQADKTGYLFKIADFGIGGIAARQAIGQATDRAYSRSRYLATALRGSYTLFYASPQQMRGENPDPRDDVYALGVIWYQLLTGDLNNGPPTGRRWTQTLRQQGMSEGAVELLASCFESRPEDRPRDAGALAERLAALPELAEEPDAPTAGPARGPTLSPEVKRARFVNRLRDLRRQYQVRAAPFSAPAETVLCIIFAVLLGCLGLACVLVLFDVFKTMGCWALTGLLSWGAVRWYRRGKALWEQRRPAELDKISGEAAKISRDFPDLVQSVGGPAALQSEEAVEEAILEILLLFEHGKDQLFLESWRGRKPMTTVAYKGHVVEVVKKTNQLVVYYDGNSISLTHQQKLGWPEGGEGTFAHYWFEVSEEGKPVRYQVTPDGKTVSRDGAVLDLV